MFLPLRTWHTASVICFNQERREFDSSTNTKTAKIVTIQQNTKAPTGHGWVAVFWLRRNSFSGLVPSNHCSQGTKECAACVWQWFNERCQGQSDKRQTQNTATQP
jgi:hypothetical protein